MLTQPDKFLPVTADPSFLMLVSSGFNGDFRVKDLSTGELYLNFFSLGQSFFRASETDVPSGAMRLELVEDQEFVKKLIRAKYAYVDLYFRN